MKQFEIAHGFDVSGWWGTVQLNAGTPVSKVRVSSSGNKFGVVKLAGKRVRLQFAPGQLREIKQDHLFDSDYYKKRFTEVV